MTIIDNLLKNTFRFVFIIFDDLYMHVSTGVLGGQRSDPLELELWAVLRDPT